MTPIHKVGFWAGIAAGTSTIAYVIIQILQIMRIIPFPMDEILIYGSSLSIVIPFVLEMLALHYVTSGKRQFWTHAALIFTIIYAVFVSANYVVQLVTVIPAKLGGTLGPVSILEQTPHSLFWNFDALGYISMGLARLFAIPALDNFGFGRWVRLSFIANASVTPLIAWVYFYPVYSEKLLIIGFPWAITAPLSMLLLALNFRKKRETVSDPMCLNVSRFPEMPVTQQE